MSKPIASEGKNILKNMIVTVLTTVIGATIVYFLGFNNKKSGLSKLEKEEATVEAWKTYVAVENIYTKNGISLIRDVGSYGGFGAMYDEMAKESERFQSSLNGVIALDGIDKDLVDVLKRRLDNEKKQLPKGRIFYAGLDSFIHSAVDREWSNKQLNDSAQKKLQDYADKSKGLMERSVADIEVLSHTLSERYDQPFSMDDFIIIQIYKHKKDPLTFLDDGKKSTTEDPVNGGVKASSSFETSELSKDYLAGKWNAGGESVITFEANGRMNWLVKPGGDDASGTWKISGEQIIMNATNPKTGKSITWEFNVAMILKDSFTMMLAKTPFNTYNMVRLK